MTMALAGCAISTGSPKPGLYGQLGTKAGQIPKDDPGVKFAFDRWWEMTGDFYPFTPDGEWFVVGAKPREIRLQIKSTDSSGKESTENDSADSFDQAGRWVRGRHYSDGEYNVTELRYDGANRLVAIKEFVEGRKQQTTTVKTMVYVREDLPTCYELDESGRVLRTVKQRFDQKRSVLSLFSAKRNDKTYAVTTLEFGDGGLKTKTQTIPAYGIHFQQKLIFAQEASRPASFEWRSLKEGAEVLIQRKSFSYKDDRLVATEVTDPREPSNSYTAQFSNYDEHGNWLRELQRSPSGWSEQLSRSIDYF